MASRGPPLRRTIARARPALYAAGKAMAYDRLLGATLELFAKKKAADFSAAKASSFQPII
jgi:hypothetical protein